VLDDVIWISLEELGQKDELDPLLNLLTLPVLLGFGIPAGALAWLAATSGDPLEPARFLPFAVTMLAWFILGERPTRGRYIGLAIITLGVACVGIENFSRTGIALTGDLLMLCGSVCWALYTVLLRKWGMQPLETAIAVTLIASMLYLPVYALFLPKALAVTPWPDIALQAFYQGVMAATVQMVLYARSVSLLGPTRMGLVMAFIPVTVGLAAVPILGEPLTPLICAGLVLVSAGAWVGNRRVNTQR
jgi:drug/metabolite transporter (DMT)-like permease